MSIESETFRARALQARQDADAAQLDNVRDRCLRAEAAWEAMAVRSERTVKLRERREAEKAEVSTARFAADTDSDEEDEPETVSELH
jgi:hypothetical protein